MILSGWLWAGGAALALLAGLWMMLLRAGPDPARPTRWIAPLAAVLLAALAGLGWRAWRAHAWPGSTPPEALVLLAGGSLVVAAWLGLRADREGRLSNRCVALGPTLITAGILLAVGAMWDILSPTPSSATGLPLARTWLLGLRNLLASIGLGGWIVAWTASLVWIVRIWRRAQAAAQTQRPEGEPVTEGELPGMIEPEAAWPAEDLGRRPALFSFPWLTAACLCGALWNVIAHAAIVRTVPAELWTLSAWLFGAAYLHVTSSWRPLRLPGWLAPWLAALVVAAGVLAASNAGSLR